MECLHDSSDSFPRNTFLDRGWEQACCAGCETHLAVLRAAEHKGLVDAAQAGAYHKATLLFLAAHILLHRAGPSAWRGAVGGGVAQLMQMNALLIEVEQQVALILANEDGGDAALLFYCQPCQLCATFQIIYAHLNKHQHPEVGWVGWGGVGTHE